MPASFFAGFEHLINIKNHTTKQFLWLKAAKLKRNIFLCLRFLILLTFKKLLLCQPFDLKKTEGRANKEIILFLNQMLVKPKRYKLFKSVPYFCRYFLVNLKTFFRIDFYSLQIPHHNVDHFFH